MHETFDVRAQVAQMWPAIALILLLGLLLTLLSFVGGSVVERATTEAVIYLIVVVGLYIFVGNSGIVSFGHISFMLLGAYAAAWQSCCPGLKNVFMPGLPTFMLEMDVPVLPAAIVAGLSASVLAFVAGSALMRLSGIAAAISTLALLAVVKISFENWDSVTSGHSSVIGLPLYVNKWVAFAWAAVAIVSAWIYRRSRWGLALRMTREDEVAARTCGINVYRERLTAFTLSAFFVGVGGALYAHYLGTVAVDMFWLDMTFITLAMLIVGGMTSLSGAVIGVMFVTILAELLRTVENGIEIGDVVITASGGLREMALAAAMLLILIFRSDGIMGGKELPTPKFLLRHRGKSEPNHESVGGESCDVAPEPPRT